MKYMASSVVYPAGRSVGPRWPGPSGINFGPSRYQQLQPTISEDDTSPGANAPMHSLLFLVLNLITGHEFYY